MASSSLRAAEGDERSEGDAALARLLDAGFGVEDYVGGFPHVFALENAHWTFREQEAGADGALVSFCAAWPLAWVRPEGVLRGVCIGSVVTASEARGRGAAGRVLERAVARAFECGFDFACLFSEKRRLYEAHGFSVVGGDSFVILHPGANHPAGAENASALERKHAALVGKGFGRSRSFRECATTSWSLTPEGLADAARVWRCVARFSEGALPALGWREFLALSKIPAMTARWLEREGRVTAVVFTGKGRDFENVMHGLCAEEWTDALFLLGECRARAPEATVTLLVEGFVARTRESFRVMSTNDVALLVRARDASNAAGVGAAPGVSVEVLSRAFRKGTLRVRGLQSC